MVFQSSTYSVLILSASKQTDSWIRALLPMTDFWPVNSARDAAEAQDLMLRDRYDILIIDSQIPEDKALSLAVTVCSAGETSVLLIVGDESYEEIYYKALPYGIFTISNTADRSLLGSSLRMLCVMRERLKGYEARQEKVNTKIEEISLVNRAKWLLIECLNMTEDEAHRYILRQAMEQRISKREAAADIIRTYQ